MMSDEKKREVSFRMQQTKEGHLLMSALGSDLEDLKELKHDDRFHIAFACISRYIHDVLPLEIQKYYIPSTEEKLKADLRKQAIENGGKPKLEVIK
jgi:hypothetical protein